MEEQIMRKVLILGAGAGGTIVANNTVVTRSIANERYIIHDSESGAGPQLHLAPTLTALGTTPGMSTRSFGRHQRVTGSRGD